VQAGALAGSTSQFLIYPLEIVKTRLAAAPANTYAGIFHCIETIVRTEGPLALFRGLVPALMGVIPYAGVDLAIFDTLKTAYRKHYGCYDISPWTILGFGTVSSVAGQTVSYPLQLVRTRLQMAGMNGKVMDPKPTMFTELRSILKTAGVRGLYRGIGPNFLKAVPAVSISYVVFEETKTLLANMEQRLLR
jgi:solute carrier family 25 phosphate transporter 23/24/25/41